MRLTWLDKGYDNGAARLCLVGSIPSLQSQPIRRDLGHEDHDSVCPPSGGLWASVVYSSDRLIYRPIFAFFTCIGMGRFLLNFLFFYFLLFFLLRIVTFVNISVIFMV